MKVKIHKSCLPKDLSKHIRQEYLIGSLSLTHPNSQMEFYSELGALMFKCSTPQIQYITQAEIVFRAFVVIGRNANGQELGELRELICQYV